MDYLKEYYESSDEDGRLTSQHGQVEFLTTMKYITECAGKTDAKRVIEIGAGTGRYSIALANRGFDVTAVELVEHNLDIMKSKIKDLDNIKAYRGSALDLTLFGSKIAPALNISKRFVGTEPYCAVTNNYNEVMKRLLPSFGVEVCEIPRAGGISASRVREALDRGDIASVRRLVPASTYEYITERCHNQ